MRSLFDKAAYNEIRTRLEHLTLQHQRQWGKMDVAQMLAHCGEAIKTPLEHRKTRRSLMSYIFGGMAKRMATSDQPYKQGLPTDKNFVIVGTREFEKEKQQLLSLVDRFHQGGEKAMTPYPHPFFGHMTPQDWGSSQYKHLDHHLRQFGA